MPTQKEIDKAIEDVEEEHSKKPIPCQAVCTLCLLGIILLNPGNIQDLIVSSTERMLGSVMLGIGTILVLQKIFSIKS